MTRQFDGTPTQPSGQADLARTAPVVKALEWEEVTAARSDEDPTLEHTGDYEAVSPIGVYYIEQYFGTDSYGWRVTMHGSDDVADKDDPSYAKAAAQSDYERRIRSALATPVAPEPAPDVVEALAEFMCSEFDEDFNPCHGYSWPEHKDDDGYRGDGGYVKLQPSDVQARSREGAKRLLTFMSQRSALTHAQAGWREITDDDQPPRDVDVIMGCWEKWPQDRWLVEIGHYGSTRGGWIHGRMTHWIPAGYLPAPPTAPGGQ